MKYGSRRINVYCGLGIFGLLILGLFLYKNATGIYSHIYKGEVAVVRMVQTERVNRIHKTCAKYRHLMTSSGYRNHTPVFFASQQYNLSYCKIGKIASTVWTRFFFILHHEGDVINDARTKPRQEIHDSMGLEYMRVGVNNSLCNQTRMVVSTRNPYTRLFSAYIDRIFIPSTTILYTNGKKLDLSTCKSKFSFSEFLTYVLNTTKLGIYDYHWSPVFYLCKPCEINPSIVFMPETFNQDINYVIDQINLEPYKHEVWSKAMQAEANLTGFSLVHDVMDYIIAKNIINSRGCLSWEQVTHRVWYALQVQGFISVNAPFPDKLYETKHDFNNTDLFRKAMVDARLKYPLSKAEILSQRRFTMNTFYSEVDQNIIAGIKEVYSVDFEMFGYSFEPPTF